MKTKKVWYMKYPSGKYSFGVYFKKPNRVEIKDTKEFGGQFYPATLTWDDKKPLK